MSSKARMVPVRSGRNGVPKSAQSKVRFIGIRVQGPGYKVQVDFRIEGWERVQGTEYKVQGESGEVFLVF